MSADPYCNANPSLENVAPRLCFLSHADAPPDDGAQWTKARLLDGSHDVARTARILPELSEFRAANLATRLGLGDHAASFAIETVVLELANYTANLAAGTCLARMENLAKSARLYHDASLISPSTLRPWLYLGRVEARRGQHQKALEYVDEVLRRDSANEWAKSIRERLADL